MYSNPIVAWKPGSGRYKIVTDDKDGETVTLYECRSKTKAEAIKEFLVNTAWRGCGLSQEHLKNFLRHRLFDNKVWHYDQIEFSVKSYHNQHMVRVKLITKNSQKEIQLWTTANKKKALNIVEFLTSLRDNDSKEQLIEFIQKIHS